MDQKGFRLSHAQEGYKSGRSVAIANKGVHILTVVPAQIGIPKAVAQIANLNRDFEGRKHPAVGPAGNEKIAPIRTEDGIEIDVIRQPDAASFLAPDFLEMAAQIVLVVRAEMLRKIAVGRGIILEAKFP